MLIREKNIEQRAKIWGVRLFFFFLLFSVFFPLEGNAQCAMCRAALESEESGVQAEAVNDGIVYLMAIPYILVGAIGFAIYRLKYGKKSKE
ncbi:MAG TPA: hypothetical protein VLB74_10615 [Flavobacterium sp.]|uniref:hypothetical protein n=1 Tax=Flavobacterium sp. TaxID=239 RepID=UPI002C7D5891|nr:hypothetical protein [Flavobacterium sp.]HSD15090.1 hypothetical protein [Flavobacterium sp.]